MCKTSTTCLCVDVGETKTGLPKSSSSNQRQNKRKKTKKNCSGFRECAMASNPTYVFPGVLIRGCSFHWAQCIWRKIQDIGLALADKNDNATRKLCRKFLALPYLPNEHIPALFEKLAAKATAPMMADLVTYIRMNWVEGKTFMCC